MTTRTITTLVAAAAAALTVGAALSGCATNATPPASTATSSPPVAQAHNQADITFAQGMIPHHAQAIAMSQMAAQRAVSPQVKDLAARIQSAQQPEIDQLSGLLRAWNAPVPSTNSPMGGMAQMGQGQMGQGQMGQGQMGQGQMGQGQMGQMGQGQMGPSGAIPGMMSGGQMQQMGQASGAAFDRMFLQMMIIHHQGAVTMAKTELKDGQNPDAGQLAKRIVDAQQREITEMQMLLGG
jgi:uncharacterized protein (DUF305 family)